MATSPNMTNTTFDEVCKLKGSWFFGQNQRTYTPSFCQASLKILSMWTSRSLSLGKKGGLLFCCAAGSICIYIIYTYIVKHDISIYTHIDPVNSIIYNLYLAWYSFLHHRAMSSRSAKHPESFLEVFQTTLSQEWPSSPAPPQPYNFHGKGSPFRVMLSDCHLTRKIISNIVEVVSTAPLSTTSCGRET